MPGFRVLSVASLILAVACANPHCPEGEFKRADTCYRLPDASADADGDPSSDIPDPPPVEETAAVASMDASMGPVFVDAAHRPDEGGSRADDASASDGAASPAAPVAMKPSTPSCVPTAEVCDGLDNDCDGRSDEGVSNPCGGCAPLEAAPGDVCSAGVGKCAAKGVYKCDNINRLSCTATPGRPTAEVCDYEDNDCDGQVDDGVANACGRCDVGPIATEVCGNGIDDNCDGRFNEDCACFKCGTEPPKWTNAGLASWNISCQPAMNQCGPLPQ